MDNFRFVVLSVLFLLFLFEYDTARLIVFFLIALLLQIHAILHISLLNSDIYSDAHLSHERHKFFLDLLFLLLIYLHFGFENFIFLIILFTSFIITSINIKLMSLEPKNRYYFYSQYLIDIFVLLYIVLWLIYIFMFMISFIPLFHYLNPIFLKFFTSIFVSAIFLKILDFFNS